MMLPCHTVKSIRCCILHNFARFLDISWQKFASSRRLDSSVFQLLQRRNKFITLDGFQCSDLHKTRYMSTLLLHKLVSRKEKIWVYILLYRCFTIPFLPSQPLVCFVNHWGPNLDSRIFGTNEIANVVKILWHVLLIVQFGHNFEDRVDTKLSCANKNSYFMMKQMMHGC